MRSFTQEVQLTQRKFVARARFVVLRASHQDERQWLPAYSARLPRRVRPVETPRKIGRICRESCYQRFDSSVEERKTKSELPAAGLSLTAVSIANELPLVGRDRAKDFDRAAPRRSASRLSFRRLPMRIRQVGWIGSFSPASPQRRNNP